jgi:beta-glucanase (GH16 family)
MSVPKPTEKSARRVVRAVTAVAGLVVILLASVGAGTAPAAAPPPAGDGATAAAARGWGTPIAAGSDEFTGTRIDGSKWGVPGECWPANPTVKGGRCASHNSVHDGYFDEHGTRDGKTGYLSSRFGQRYGRWEARMRIVTTASGKAFHPVLLTWPDSEQWPSGGELDYLEINSNSTRAAAFIHHTDGGQDACTGPAINFSQWHNYAVEWQPGHIRGFIDGVQWFDSTNPLSQPPGPHHATAQLDNFVGTSGMADVHMQVDFYRAYAP